MNFLSIALYHGCGRCYLDGTNELIADNEGCTILTNNPFGKKPEDSYNKISKSTRSKFKKKTYATLIYCKKFFSYLKSINSKDYKYWSTYESDYSSDEDSPSDVESNLSDKLPDNNKVNVISVYNTGKDLIIVEDTVQDPIKQENPGISDISDNIPNNKITKNKLIPELM